MTDNMIADQPPVDSGPAGRTKWLRFGVRTLLLVTLVVAAFVAGRRSTTETAAPEVSGAWTAKLPAGAEQPTTLTRLSEDRIILSSGGDVFNGVYKLQDGQLVMERPSDRRMRGLAWKWDGQQWTLVSEPQGTPTGSSYLGTVLVRNKNR